MISTHPRSGWSSRRPGDRTARRLQGSWYWTNSSSSALPPPPWRHFPSRSAHDTGLSRSPAPRSHPRRVSLSSPFSNFEFERSLYNTWHYHALDSLWSSIFESQFFFTTDHTGVYSFFYLLFLVLCFDATNFTFDTCKIWREQFAKFFSGIFFIKARRHVFCRVL